MASMEASIHATQTKRQARYVPKLSYRTGASGQSNRDSVSTIATGLSTAPSTLPPSTQPSASSSPMPSPGLPPDATRPTNSRLPSDAMSTRPATSRISSKTPTATPTPPKSPGLPKKKGGSFFSFLNVKEPSAQAFEDYQNQMRKKAQTQKGRATAVGMPGVSSAKLPPTVPKVNTKWDGVPRAMKEKNSNKGKDQQRPSVSGSIRSPGKDEGDGLMASARSRANTAYSTGSGNRLAEIYGWDTPRSSNSSLAKDFALEHARPKKTQSTTTLPETTLFPTHPPLPVRSISDRPPMPESASASSSIPPSMPELPASSAIVPELSGIPSSVPELRGSLPNPPELASPPVGNIPELGAAPRSRSVSRDRFSFTATPPPPYSLGRASPVPSMQKEEPVSPPPRNPLRPPPLPELQGDIRPPLGMPKLDHSPCTTPSEHSPITPNDPSGLGSLAPSSPNFEASDRNDLNTTVLVVPNSNDTVIVRSAGVNIMPAPVPTRRKASRHTPQHLAFLAGDAEEMTIPGETEPHLQSISKKDGTPRKSNHPTRPSLATYFNSPVQKKEPATNATNMKERLQASASQRKSVSHAFVE